MSESYGQCKWCKGKGERAIPVGESTEEPVPKLTDDETKELRRKQVFVWSRIAMVTLKYVFKECSICNGTGSEISPPDWEHA